MKKAKQIIEQKDAIAGKWFDLIIKSYPEQSYKHLKVGRKQFSNPIGYTIFHESQIILEQLTGDFDKAVMSDAIRNIIKIRAVQDFSASEACMFMVQLKDVLYDIFDKETSHKYFDDVFKRIDAAALMAFDIYMESKELLYSIKANEIKKRTFKMIDRLNRKYDMLDDDEIDERDM